MEKLEKSPEVLGRAYKSNPGPMLFKVRRDGGKVCHKIEVVNADEQHGNSEDQDVCRHEDIYGAEDHMIHRASIKIGSCGPDSDGDSGRALLSDRNNSTTRDTLMPPAGTSRAGTDKH